MPAILVAGPTGYAELAISSLLVVLVITSTHLAYAQNDGLAELAWVAWLNTKTVYWRMVAHLGTNPVRCRVTPFMYSMASDIWC